MTADNANPRSRRVKVIGRPAGPAAGRGTTRRRARTAPTIGQSALAHLPLIGALALLGVLLGVAYGVTRAPLYSSEARLIVGKNVNLTNVAAAAGLPSAEQSFAADYARLVSSAEVTRDVGHRLHQGAAYTGTLTATPVPNSATISVLSKAGTPQASAALADAGAAAIVDEVNAINTGNQATLDGLLTQYRQAQARIGDEGAQRDALQAQIAALGQGAPAAQVASLRSQLTQVEAKISTDQLQANAVQSQYQAQYSPVQSEQDVVAVQSSAVPAGSDRTSHLELGVVAGAFVGVLCAIAYAAWSDQRAARRS